jgi:hypothetical protein
MRITRLGLFFMTPAKSPARKPWLLTVMVVYMHSLHGLPGIPFHLLAINLYDFVPGIGIRVKVWLNVTGEYDGDTDDFNADYSNIISAMRISIGQAKRIS